MKWYKKDQHFLKDKQVLDRIIEYGRLNKSDTVLEIGAGYGNLTQRLAEKAGRVIAYEVDTDLASPLNRLDNVELISGDVMKQDFPHFNKVVSNLPYSISSPVTFKLLTYKFELGILMYQHEFARRMVAVPGTKDYGRLSISIQYFSRIEILEVIPGKAFNPAPDVDSAIIRLEPRPPPYTARNVEFFMKFIKAAFSHRRKRIKNAILNNADFLGIERDAIRKLPSDFLNRRAETFYPEELAALSDLLCEGI